jgi:CRISPR/Cas system CSM-associated protein Csm3 (group 7 of RAMP superfamily)
MSDNKNWWHGEQSRRIVSRVAVEGTLRLQTPASFGGGDDSDLTDMPLLVDALDDKTPLLTGASLAGALRSHLRARELGYLAPEPAYYEDNRERRQAQKQEWATQAQILFGGEYIERRRDGRREILLDQSAVIIDDALGRTPGMERRPGVRLDPASRTAAENKLFDAQLWLAGTTFPLRLELIIRESDNGVDLKQALADALAGLSDGAITLGRRKRRGFGRVTVEQWRTKTYDLQSAAGLLDWLENGARPLAEQENAVESPDIYQALGAVDNGTDARRWLDLLARFALDGSLLIRSPNTQGDQVADFVHLQTRQPNGQQAPILSGTSLTGALRARAYKIVNSLADAEKALAVTDSLFGPDMEMAARPRASRLLVRETCIQKGVVDLVQNRVSIDRFTGGARDTALFNEQPVWGKPETEVALDLRLINPTDADIGLLLLLLKDLWTGDLPLGGESSVGRGRLKGKSARLILGETVWEIKDVNGRLQFSGNGAQTELQDTYLQAFLTEVGHG